MSSRNCEKMLKLFCDRSLARRLKKAQWQNFRFGSTRACIVGAGPAGYYTAQRLLKGDGNIKVDLIDKVPVPFGLVRFGVAPDHPEVKNVINTFTQTATKYKERCRFIGNLEVGRDVQASQLLQSYDLVVLSYGAENDRKLGIAGEESQGVYSAREFVGWYNGLPEFTQLKPDLSKETAIILGQGNVALDIARLLLMPTEELAKTDICEHALSAIAESKLRTIYVIGRRGPLQAAFTIKEFREQTKLPLVETYVPAEDIKDINIADLPRPRRRLTELIMKMSKTPSHSLLGNKCHKSCNLKFCLTPQEVLTQDGSIKAVRFLKNRLEGEDIETQKAVATGETLVIPCGIVIRSIGYQSLSIADEEVIPFDFKTHTIPNAGGRVQNRPGLYCSGWVKRGPVGVIANTMSDAFETADSILADLKSGIIPPTAAETEPLEYLLQNSGSRTVSFKEWEEIDREETIRGEGKGKPREKIVTVTEMLEIAKR